MFNVSRQARLHEFEPVPCFSLLRSAFKLGYINVN